MTPRKIATLMAAVGCLCGGAALADPPVALDWFTMDSGAQMFADTSGGFEVGGTIGQPDVGTASGDGFELTGGFWVIVRTRACPGDADGNRTVDQDDIDIVLFNMGQTVEPGTQGDVNRDGTVGQDDLDIVLFNLWNACPQ